MKKPRCLNGLTVEPVPPTWNDVPNSVFQIRCSSCDASGFALEEVQTGGSSTGLVLICESCGHPASVFDGLKHGYDGELGHTDHLEGETTRERLLWNDDTPKRPKRVVLQFIYNIEKSELDEIAKESNVATIDLFDWFNVIEDNPSGEVIWEYECA